MSSSGPSHGAGDGCPLHRLAAARIGQVALCRECAALHLSVQCLTLRMDPAAFLELVDLLVQARARLVAHGAAAEAPAEADADAGATQGALH